MSIELSAASALSQIGTPAARRVLVHLLSAFFMLLKAANNLLYLSVLTTFLDKAGAHSLPWVYLLVNVCFIIFQYQIMTRIVGREGHWLLSILAWPAAAASFAAALFFPVETPPLLIGFLILAMMIDLIGTQAFTAMLNHFLTIGEARRNLPLIYAAGSFGFIISGLLLKFVLDFVGLNGLLAGNGFIVLASAIILLKLTRFETARQSEVKTEQEELNEPDVSQKPDEPSTKHPLARLLIISSFLLIFNKYLIDFLFAASLSAYFTSGNDLAAFMGVFSATTDLTVIGMQTFVMHRIFAAFPIGKVLTFMPAVLVILCIFASFSLKFAVIAGVQFLVMLNSKNFVSPAQTILMGVISQKNRVFYRRDMSVACSVSSAIVGVVLLLVRSNVGFDALFLMAAVCYLLMALVHSQLDSAYVKTLRSAMGKRDNEEFAGDKIAALRFIQRQERISSLKELLEDEDPRIRASAIEEVACLPPALVDELLSPKLETETEPRCLNQITRNLLQVTPDTSAGMIQRLLADTSDQRLRSDVIETIGKIRSNALNEDCVLPFLDHEHHRVRASAVISTVRMTRSQSNLELAMRRLAQMARDSRELMRASAAAVMGELGLPLFVPALAKMADHSEPVVAGNVAQALSRIQTPAALAVLENMLFHPNNDVILRVEGLLETATKDSIGQISRLMLGITSEERQRLAVKLRSGRHQDSHELLATILCVENAGQRKNLVTILERAEKAMLELMKKCIQRNDGAEILLSVDPLIELAIATCPMSLPVWVPLLNALAAGSIENSDLQAESANGPKLLLKELWAEWAGCIGAGRKGIDQLKTRTDICLKLLACMSNEPATFIKSIDQLREGSNFSRSMAAEYIEAKTGRAMVAMLAPLADNSLDALQTIEELKSLALQNGVELTDDLIQVASERLKNNLPQQEISP